MGGETYAALLAFHRESFRAVNDARQRIEKSELTKLYTIFCLFNFDGCGSQKRLRAEEVKNGRGGGQATWRLLLKSFLPGAHIKKHKNHFAL